VGKIQVWVSAASGELRTVEWNACGCCPKSTIEYWGNRFKERGSYYFKSKEWARRWRAEYRWHFVGYL
jgi:hypothetical protein